MNDLECLGCVVRYERFCQTLKAWTKNPNRLEVFDPDREPEPPPPTVWIATTHRVIVSPTGSLVTVPVCRAHTLADTTTLGLPEWK